jgi:S-adenosylmethionine hydrolase
VAPGALFWYPNANGLLEIAQNMGNAAQTLSVEVGSTVSIESNCAD